VVQSRSQLAAALEALPALRGTSGWRASRVAWLSPARFAVIASTRSRTVLAVFSGRRIVAFKQHVSSRSIELRGSPRGNYVVLGTASGVRVYDARRTFRAFGASACSSPSRGRATSVGGQLHSNSRFCWSVLAKVS
jgi:hypothetical protein